MQNMTDMSYVLTTVSTVDLFELGVLSGLGAPDHCGGAAASPDVLDSEPSRT